jgi:hypothetical protein
MIKYKKRVNINNNLNIKKVDSIIFITETLWHDPPWIIAPGRIHQCRGVEFRGGGGVEEKRWRSRDGVLPLCRVTD